MVRWTSLFATILMLPLPSMADLLFEGWSKITSGGVHVGYVVNRYEFDPKTKHFTSTSFTKTGSLGSDITESLKAVADQDLKPISYSYTSIVGKKTKVIDATFAKDKMTATVVEEDATAPEAAAAKAGGKATAKTTAKSEAKPVKRTISRDLPKGSFLSTFLVYLLLKSKSGMKTKDNRKYDAIAEEDADVHQGRVYIGEEEMKNGIRSFRVLNSFKNEKFVSYVTDHGEVVMTESPDVAIGTELVARPADAVGEFGTSATILKNLFGEVPKGTDNIVSKAALEKALAPPPESAKKEGIPPGKGLIQKPGVGGGDGK